MKTIIETDGYPMRVILVPENDEDRKLTAALKTNFCEDEDSDTVAEYEEVDDLQDYGQGVFAFSAYCNLN